MVRVIDPKVGETVYDPACGTGGFLAQSYEYLQERLGEKATGDQIDVDLSTSAGWATWTPSRPEPIEF